MLGILRYTASIWRAGKRNKFSLAYSIISNNLKTGLITLNKSTSTAIGFVRSLKI